MGNPLEAIIPKAKSAPTPPPAIAPPSREDSAKQLADAANKRRRRRAGTGRRSTILTANQPVGDLKQTLGS